VGFFWCCVGGALAGQCSCAGPNGCSGRVQPMQWGGQPGLLLLHRHCALSMMCRGQGACGGARVWLHLVCSVTGGASSGNAGWCQVVPRERCVWGWRPCAELPLAACGIGVQGLGPTRGPRGPSSRSMLLSVPPRLRDRIWCLVCAPGGWQGAVHGDSSRSSSGAGAAYRSPERDSY
jgi:hypothetical protein